MLQEVERFFVAFIGEEVYTEYSNVIMALIVGFSLMIVYGLLVRPILNLCVGKKKNFFDIIMMVLILIVGVKIAFPGLFTVDGFTQDDLDKYYDIGYSDGYDLGEGEGYDKGYNDALGESVPDITEPVEPELLTFESNDAFFEHLNDLYQGQNEDFPDVMWLPDSDYGYHYVSGYTYSPYSSMYVITSDTTEELEIFGTPYAVVNGVTFNRFYPPADVLVTNSYYIVSYHNYDEFYEDWFIAQCRDIPFELRSIR